LSEEAGADGEHTQVTSVPPLWTDIADADWL